ncbi:uncharacterized protein LOC108339411 isoform X3 [Vigna angularis]|uniref:uncharacterized protein LOC108339411 isoform X3 n=1 Tax=Phaseolus angularis TaxID=3914 RepID=UPI0022B57D92|nr:uncharacterized protein LOC108339411 isoform X3 [Vigna angularis]
MKKMTYKKKETKHHTQQSASHTWGHTTNHPPAPQVQSSPSLSAPQRRTYKLKLPSTSQSTCTPAHNQSPNAFVFQSAWTPAPIQSPDAFVFHSSVQVDPSNEDVLHSPLQVGGNSHVQDEHEQDENQDTLLEVEQKRPLTHKGAWLVDVIDDQCKMTTKHLKTNDVWNLPQNERIIVHWNEEYQPIGDGGALLNRFLGSIARNFKAKFVVNSDIQINYILKALNHKWRDCRLELWQQRDDGTRTRDELIAMAPEGIDRDHWASFVDYRLDERTKEIALKNKHNRTKQTLAHTGGSKSIARKREEMEKECGHKVSRGEVWIATHKTTNGAFVSDEAREIGEKIQTYESTTSSQSKEISSLDSLAHVLGSQEHCGRVRGLGLGPCPSKVFGVHARSHVGSSSSTPSNVELQSQVSSLTSSNVKLESQVSSLTSQVNEMKAIMTLLLQNHQGPLPSQFAVFQRSSVSDQGSGPNNGCNEEKN